MIEKDFNVYLADVGGEKYLIQGDADDSLVMMREVDNLLECERDPVQKILGEPGYGEQK